MSAAKKIDPSIESNDPVRRTTNKMGDEEPIPLWRQKKNNRQKLLRAIRAKSFSHTVRAVIRSELKKNGNSEDNL
jgi:hypothetical protein